MTRPAMTIFYFPRVRKGGLAWRLTLLTLRTLGKNYVPQLPTTAALLRYSGLWAVGLCGGLG